MGVKYSRMQIYKDYFCSLYLNCPLLMFYLVRKLKQICHTKICVQIIKFEGQVVLFNPFELGRKHGYFECFTSRTKGKFILRTIEPYNVFIAHNHAISEYVITASKLLEYIIYRDIRTPDSRITRSISVEETR